MITVDHEPWILSSINDVTIRKRAEDELRRKNRALATLGQCNQFLVRVSSETDLLDEICRICVEIGGYRLAWVGYAESDEQKTVRPVAQKGFEDGYLESANITWADNERGRGPTGTAIRTRQIYIARNIPQDPAFVPWRAAALRNLTSPPRRRPGLAAAAVPLPPPRRAAAGSRP